MFRPSIHPSPRQLAVGRNLALDLVAAVGVGVTVALVTTLLPTIARRGGLEPIGLAALAAAPFIANLLGAFAGRVGPRSQRQLVAHPGGRVRHRCCPRGPRRGAGHDRRVDRVLAQPLAERPVPPAPVGRDVPGPHPWPRRRLPRFRAGRGGRARRPRRRRPGGPVRWRDGGRPGRCRRTRLRPRVRRPPGAERGTPADLLRPRFHPRAARPADPRRGSPWPRGSTAAA